MATTPKKDADHHDTLPEDVVPIKTKVAMGAANMVSNFSSNLTKELLNPVFVVTLGLSPAVVGMTMVIYRLYDAFVDPVIGLWSDNTRTSWGRRRPWLLAGAILCALMMPVMWLVNRDWSHPMQTAWMIGVGMVLYTCMSVWGVPYESLLMELTPDYKERTRISSYKMVISSVAGLLIGWSWYITQLPFFNDPVTGKPDTLHGALGISILAAVIILIVGIGAVVFSRERFYVSAQKQAKSSMKDNLSSAIKSRPFLIIVGIAVLCVTGSSLASGIGFFTRLYYVCQGDTILASKINGIQSTCWMPISILSVFVFQNICTRWSKTHALAIALCFSLASVVSQWWLFRPDMPYLSLGSSFLLAVGVTGMWQMLPAMNADVVDADELHTSARREGAFAAVFSWFMKVSFTAGMGLPGLIVGWCGFVVAKGNFQDLGVITHLRLSHVLIPAGLTAAAIVLIIFYPLSVHRMGEIRRELELRRGRL